jgi:hypothetical protein
MASRPEGERKAMKVKITAETIAAWDHVWLAPDGKRGRKLIIVTSVQREGNSVTVHGVLQGTRTPVTVSNLFDCSPVDMEV